MVTNMHLEVSFKTQFRALRELVIISIVYFGFMIFIYVKVEFELFKILFLSTLVLYFVVFFTPVVLLHTNYLKSKLNSIKIEQNKLEIDGNQIVSNDIEKIKIVATYQHFDKMVGASALPYNDYYYYVEIYLNNGQSLKLTSLLDYKIDEILKKFLSDVKFTNVISSYSYILW